MVEQLAKCAATQAANHQDAADRCRPIWHVMPRRPVWPHFNVPAGTPVFHTGFRRKSPQARHAFRKMVIPEDRTPTHRLGSVALS